jgi:hypothetical protein
MKKLFLVVAVCLLGCDQPKTYSQYKTVEFCRDTYDFQVVEMFNKDLLGYSYIGPLNANGINCTRVLFGR